MLDHGRRVLRLAERHRLRAQRPQRRARVWTYHAAGAVKASPTLSGGVLYFGDYSGRLQAISERTGRRIWVSQSEGALLGSGTFYSTAAVVYGRVFLGNTDGRIYAYDASTGKLDWAVQTGAYVYASPAVTNAPGLGPTIYLGSYNGSFYALNARSGHISWRFNAHGRISGSATIVGRIVYFADLGTPPHLRPRHLHRPRASSKTAPAPSTPSSATAPTSTSPATPASTASRPPTLPAASAAPRPPSTSAKRSRSKSHRTLKARASEKRARHHRRARARARSPPSSRPPPAPRSRRRA